MPSPVPVTAASLQAIAARLGVPGAACAPFPSVGTGNAVYALGDRYLLRVPHRHPTSPPVVAREIAAVTAARVAGVHTPAIVYHDASCGLLPVPYAVYERVAGVPLGTLPERGASLSRTWFAVGQDLARLHSGVSLDSDAGRLTEPANNPPPHAWLDEVRATGLLHTADAEWLAHWLARLWPFVEATSAHAFCHGDVNADNILVDTATGAYLALIDWGGAVWADPAWDFVPSPLDAVPPMLEGYRARGPLPDDAHAEARILAYRLQFAIWRLRFWPPGAPIAAYRMAALRAGTARFLGQARARWMLDL